MASKKAATDAQLTKPAAGFVIGRDGFAKISAVEGIRLSEQMTERVREADRRGLSNQERRDAIIRAHRKA